MIAKISIIIPSYQHGSTIDACLKSIFAQTLLPFEVIVVNDGSTDNTIEVLKPWEDRVKVVNQINQGGNTARNRGFKESTGNFVLFCDADMTMEKNMLELLHYALTKNENAAYAYSGFQFGWKVFSSYEFSGDRLKEGNFIHTSALIKREKFPGFDESIKRFQDWDVWLTMLEKGSVGVFVNEVLFKVATDKKRGGISTWRPSFLYKVPWPKKVIPKSVKAYFAAREIIYKKHGIKEGTSQKFCVKVWQKIKSEPVFWISFVSLLLVFLLSIAVFKTTLTPIVLVLVALFVLFVTMRRLEYGMSIAFLELFANSHGHLIDAEIGGTAISLRMVVFGGVMLGYAIRLLTRKTKFPRVTQSEWVWIPVVIAVLLGFVRGFMLQSAGVAFQDGNAYLYLAYLVPLLSITPSRETFSLWLKNILAAAVYVALLSLGTLYVFTHFPAWMLVKTYAFLRDTRTAEITQMHPTFYRVFLQAQIVSLLAIFLSVSKMLFGEGKKKNRIWVILLTLSTSAIILSLSRSFWLGAGVAGLCILFAWFFNYGKSNLKRTLKTSSKFVLAGVLSVVVLGGIVLFPWPYQTGSIEGFGSVFASRTGSGDVAVTSRWNLLEPMWTEIKKAPVIGSGFGREITYISDDPRVRAEFPDGVWRTYSVEWGYLELWLKMGLLGPLSFIILGGVIVLRLYKQFRSNNGDWISLGFIGGVISLYVMHVFSPYLNHPLGLGILLVGYAATKLSNTLKHSNNPI